MAPLAPPHNDPLPGAPPRRAGPAAQTSRRRAIFAGLFSIAVITLSCLSLSAFKHSLSLSSFTISGEPANTSFDVARCASAYVYRSGKTDGSGTARVTVPFGCWEARTEKGDVKGFTPQTATADSTGRDATALVVLGLLGIASFALLYPAVQSLRHSSKSARTLASGDVCEARIQGDEARQWSSYAFGIGTALAVVALLFLFLSLANGGVRTPFFKFELMGNRFGLLLRRFGVNIKIFILAEVFVLIWGLIVAIARLAPGVAGKPVRALAIFYIDLFRGIPAVIVIFLLDFGLKKSGIPWLSKLDDFWYGVMALTLTYGAYVAEVYRSGIDSIHWSQTAASRSLGLSYSRTLRYVVMPQAIRRIIPPLLNDFIGLQKDTALVSFVGVVEIFNQARTINSNNFNLSAITVAAVLFYVITVPQARLVDYLIRRDQTRTRANG